jgi:hypothetical protein
MEVSDKFHAPTDLSLENILRYALDRRLDGPKDRSEPCGEIKILLLFGIVPRSSSLHIPTELVTTEFENVVP